MSCLPGHRLAIWAGNQKILASVLPYLLSRYTMLGKVPSPPKAHLHNLQEKVAINEFRILFLCCHMKLPVTRWKHSVNFVFFSIFIWKQLKHAAVCIFWVESSRVGKVILFGIESSLF